MKPIQEIYTAYKTMPMIQMHQLRVAAVALMICENLIEKVNTQVIIETCLLHDMGNIIKADVESANPRVPVDNRAHWQIVKQEYINKYGLNADEASKQIIDELNLINGKEILSHLSWIGHTKFINKTDYTDLEYIITPYADSRVAPSGVTTLKERINEAISRYNFKTGSEEILQKLTEIEENIFKGCRIKPEDITEESIQPYIANVNNYELKV